MLALIQQTAERHGLDPMKFLAQLKAESGLNPAAVSPKGAVGVAQFMPGTAKAFGIDPRDPAQAIPAAGQFMRQNLDRFEGSYPSALAAYNWGPGNVSRVGGNQSLMPAETRAYVAKIEGGGGGSAPPAAPPGGTLAPGGALAMLPWPNPGMQPPAPAPRQLYDPATAGLADLLTGMGRKTTGLNKVDV